MRKDGEITEQDMRVLVALHENALDLAKACLYRIKLGSDKDGHANSWWRHYDSKIEEIAKDIESKASRFNSGK